MWWTSHSLVDKTFINVRIFRNLPRALGSIFVRTLFSCSAYSPWTFTGNGFASPRPKDMDPSSPSYRARQASFLSFQLHPSPLLVRCYLRKRANWGDDKRIIGWRFDVHELTGEYDGVNRDKVEGTMVGKEELVKYTKCLTSCPEVIMAHDTCHFLIGFYLGLKCRFIFHALFL